MIYLLILITILQLADIVSTYYALQMPGVHEGNPLMAKVMEKLGVLPGLILAKGIFVAFIWFYPLPMLALWVISVAYVAVVGNNISKLRSK